ncbi:MAG: DcaP family trimeric outer membrane transporter [Pseudomonadota bacterium]
MKLVKDKLFQPGFLFTGSFLCTSGFLCVGFMVTASVHAATPGTLDGTTVTYGGYVKLDAIASSYNGGSLPNGNFNRDFYVPSLIPVSGAEANTTFDMHARQTRFNLGTSSTIDGVALKTFIEMDFQATPIGDDRVTNGYAPELRLAYISYGNWMFGQNWSTFQNISTLPDTVDFIGNTDGGIFVRQAQIRYTYDNWQFSLENPETTITPYSGGARIVADQNPLPDLVSRYNLSAGGLSMSFAVLARQLVNNDAVQSDNNISSISFSVTGKWMIGQDDIRFGINSGDGLGRYVGLNTTNDAVLTANGELEAISTAGAFFSYRHLWNDQWRSNLIYSQQTIDNDITLTGTGATKKTYSARANLFYSATPKLNFGVEYTYAIRELETGRDGAMNRLQFTAKLDF